MIAVPQLDLDALEHTDPLHCAQNHEKSKGHEVGPERKATYDDENAQGHYRPTLRKPTPRASPEKERRSDY
jgi:hypothetical protein